MQEGYSDKPFATGSIVGIRLFYSNSFRPNLRSLTLDYVWTEGVNEAMCMPWATASYSFKRPTKHYVGVLDCTCGFYAAFSTDEIVIYAGCGDWQFLFSNSTNVVPALIEGFGNVSVGTKGFRASKARILALGEDFFGSSQPEVSRYVAEQYKLPIFPTVFDAMEEFPISDPKDFL